MSRLYTDTRTDSGKQGSILFEQNPQNATGEKHFLGQSVMACFLANLNVQWFFAANDQFQFVCECLAKNFSLNKPYNVYICIFWPFQCKSMHFNVFHCTSVYFLMHFSVFLDVFQCISHRMSNQSPKCSTLAGNFTIGTDRPLFCSQSCFHV